MTLELLTPMGMTLLTGVNTAAFRMLSALNSLVTATAKRMLLPTVVPPLRLSEPTFTGE